MKAEKHTLTNARGASLTLYLHPSKIRRTGDYEVEWTISPKQWNRVVKASNQYPNSPWFTVFLEEVTFKCHLKDSHTRIFNQSTLRQAPSTTTTTASSMTLNNESKALASVLKRVMEWYTHTTKDTMPTQLFDEAFAALNTHTHTQERKTNERTNNHPN